MLPIHARVRDATADAHARLDARMPYLDPALTRERYAEVLRRTRAFHAALEPALARWSAPLAALGLDVRARSKLALLDRDLEALGARPVPNDSSLSDVAAIPSTLGRALGALYVMEGATLGGQVIRRQLATSLGLREENGAAYLASYGDETGPMWRAFLASLAQSVESEQEIVHGALDTFAAFERHVALQEKE